MQSKTAEKWAKSLLTTSQAQVDPDSKFYTMQATHGFRREWFLSCFADIIIGTFRKVSLT